MAGSGILPDPNPNNRYDENHSIMATLSSTTDTNQFCNTYNHNNKYGNLKLGQIISIYYSGSYIRWYIAGFDVESNKIASDGKSYDNGYGIALVPETAFSTSEWNDSNVRVSYMTSTMHTVTLPKISNDLKTVLGSHLINRNVLVGSNTNDSATTAYRWTTTYATLMSIGQMTGNFAYNHTKYDDGEANYKLPLFDYMNYDSKQFFYSRNYYGKDHNSNYYGAYGINPGGNISYGLFRNLGTNRPVRPLIYIR